MKLSNEMESLIKSLNGSVEYRGFGSRTICKLTLDFLSPQHVERIIGFMLQNNIKTTVLGDL